MKLRALWVSILVILSAPPGSAHEGDEEPEVPETLEAEPKEEPGVGEPSSEESSMEESKEDIPHELEPTEEDLPSPDDE